jgi:hypothetical protein
VGIFFTDGQERLKTEVSSWGEFLSSAECYLLVYKASHVGPSGFDRFPEGQALVEHILRTSTLLARGLDSIPLVQRPLFELVRKEASPGCVSFDSPDSTLRTELENLQHLRDALKKQALLKRYGRNPPPQPPALLRSLFQGSQEVELRDPPHAIDSKCLEFVLKHSSHACIWRWGEFGLHFLSLSRDKGGLLQFIEQAAHELDVELIRISSIREIPTW